MVVTYFKALFQDMSGRTKRYHETHQSEYRVPRPKIELGTCGKRNRDAQLVIPHNLLCCFSTGVYCYCCLFRYRLSPETFGYTIVLLLLITLESVTKLSLATVLEINTSMEQNPSLEANITVLEHYYCYHHHYLLL
jgi:hypothetical protein